MGRRPNPPSAHKGYPLRDHLAYLRLVLMNAYPKKGGAQQGGSYFDGAGPAATASVS